MAVHYAPDQAKQGTRDRFRGVWAAGLPADRAGALAAG
jgi:hypothetical protein